MKLLLRKGTTSKLIRFVVLDSSSTIGARRTGLTSTSFTAFYIREGQNNEVAITLSVGVLGTWSSGGLKEIDATNMPGWYELGIPDAALANGADSVGLCLKDAAANNIVQVDMEIQLGPVDRLPHDWQLGGY